MTCVDVGANWGYFTLAAAHAVGSRGRVIAVEADSIACTALRANLGRNRLAQVTVLEMAARERTGDAWMWHYSPDASDSRNFGLASTNMDGFGKQLRVRAGPLDEALDLLGVDRIDLLKMDIEGDEGRALTGLIRRLGPHHLPRILLELHPFQLERQGSSAQAVIEQLRRSGYHAWVIDHSASVTRQVAAGRRDASSTLAPLIDGAQLGTWPHVLFAGEAAPRFAKFEVPRPPIVKGAHVTPSARQVDEIIRTGAARDAAEQI
jgi:FkbM family methyltransferase